MYKEISSPVQDVDTEPSGTIRKRKYFVKSKVRNGEEELGRDLNTNTGNIDLCLQVGRIHMSYI